MDIKLKKLIWKCRLKMVAISSRAQWFKDHEHWALDRAWASTGFISTCTSTSTRNIWVRVRVLVYYISTNTSPINGWWVRLREQVQAYDTFYISNSIAFFGL